MIFGKRKRVTTNRATRPFWAVAGSGMDVREKFGKSEVVDGDSLINGQSF